MQWNFICCHTGLPDNLVLRAEDQIFSVQLLVDHGHAHFERGHQYVPHKHSETFDNLLLKNIKGR